MLMRLTIARGVQGRMALWSRGDSLLAAEIDSAVSGPEEGWVEAEGIERFLGSMNLEL